MATPAELEALTASLRDAYESAWSFIKAEQDAIAGDPAKFTRRGRLRELRAAVDDRLDQVDETARAWLANEFPNAYRFGAESAAATLGEAFRFTTIDEAAVTLLAQDTFADLLAATNGVSDSTKRLIRELGKNQALLKTAAGKTAPQAARDLRRLLEARGIYAVRYADGSRHGLAEYTDMMLRTVTAKAHNAGTLNFGRRSGTEFYEVFDGSGDSVCADANGRIVDADWAFANPLGHPRCQRSFGARPDVTTAEQARTAEPSTTAAQRADQAASERARAEAQRTRRNTRARRQTAAERRTVARQAREGRAAGRQARAARAGTQGDLGLDRLPPLPKPADLPGRIDTVTPEGLAAARKELPKLKANVRSAAGEVRDEAQFALDAADVFQMAPPYARGSVEARSTGLYDWFWSLHPDEQARLRSGWMKGHRQTANPDLIAERMGNFYGGADYDTSIARWLEETRRYDAAGALQRGKLPAQTRYGDLDIDSIFGDGTYKVADLFDSDPDHAARSVANTLQEQSEEFAGRAFARPSGDRPAPYQMTEREYIDELTAVEAKARDIRPVRTDADFGDEFTPEDEAVLRRLNELVPLGIEGAETLPADVLHQKVMELARTAGLI